MFHISMLKPSTPNTFHQRSKPLPASVIIDEEPEYKISKIDHQKACKLLYKVIWLGYKDTDNDSKWLPVTELEYTKELVNNFHLKYPTKLGHYDPDIPSFHFLDSVPSQSLWFKKKKIIIIIIIEYLYTFWSAVSYALTYLLVFCSTVSIARNWILVFFHSFPCSHQLLVFHFINYYYSHPFPTHRKKQINFDIIKIENYKIPVPIENTTGEKLPPPSSTPSISLSSSCLTISLSSFSILSIPSFSCLPFFLFSCTSLSSPSDSGHKISSSSES